MLCKICSTNETDNPDGIWDDCKILGWGRESWLWANIGLPKVFKYCYIDNFDNEGII